MAGGLLRVDIGQIESPGVGHGWPASIGSCESNDLGTLLNSSDSNNNNLIHKANASWPTSYTGRSADGTSVEATPQQFEVLQKAAVKTLSFGSTQPVMAYHSGSLWQTRTRSWRWRPTISTKQFDP